MKEEFHFIDEPLLSFGSDQTAEDPRDGLALFGPGEKTNSMGDHIVIGTPKGLELWKAWSNALNTASSCADINRHRPWPPYPGYDVAFGSKWPDAIKAYHLDSEVLDEAIFKANRFERAFSVASQYLEPIKNNVPKLDAKPSLAICIVPDSVHKNCRPESYVPNPSDTKRTKREVKSLEAAIYDHHAGQDHLFPEEEIFGEAPSNFAQYGLSPDFRRQLKARIMEFDIPVQIVKESTLEITDQVRKGEPGTNPLSDRLWNMGTALYYKSGRKPWRTPWARDGVCYIGLAYKRDDRDSQSACCAAQMFLDSGDGVVFVGELGRWYSERRREFHLTPNAAERLLRGALETHSNQDGRPLKEIFIHARSGIDREEFEGFKRACPDNVQLIGVRVRQDRGGPRLFRFDNHPKAARRGLHPVLRGTFWRRTERHGLLFTTGFKPRIATYDGWEVPVPLSVTIQHGEADLLQVATDILGLTKLNYNTCQLGEAEPITVKYSDRIGEILLANPDLPRTHWRPNFKFYI